MSKPINFHGHTATSATGVSEAVHTKAHYTVALFLHTANVDPANDTVEAVVEVSPDGTEVTLTAADLTGENGYAMVHGALGQQLRVNLRQFTDASDSGADPVADLTVDTWLITGGWNGPAFGV